MDATGASISRKIISTTAPCHFVDKTETLLEEIKDKKGQFDKKYDRSDRAARTAEYYDLLDSSARDGDALDNLRLRSLLQNQLKVVEEEVRNDAKKKLAKQFAQDMDVRSKNLPKADTRGTRFKIDSRPNVSSKSSLPNVKLAQPHPILPARNTSKSIPIQKELSQSQCKEVVRDSQSFPEMKDLNTKYRIEDKSEVPPILHRKLSDIVEMMFKRVNHPRLDGNRAPERDKYFPCAIPLGPPSRRKVSEVVIDDSEEEANDVSSVTELPPAVTIDTVHSSSEKLVLQKKLTAPPVMPSKIVTVHSVSKRPMSQRKLTIETLPSINIIGKLKSAVAVNSKLFCFQAEDAGAKSESPEILERQNSPDVKGYEVPSSHIRNSEQRVTTTQLSGILNALNQCRTEMYAERTQLDRKQIENLVIKIIAENMQKDNVFRTREMNSKEEANKMVNVETQTTEQMNKTATVSTQTECKRAIDKVQQTTFVIPSKSAITQTEVKGNLDEEITFVKRLEDHGLSFHQCCKIPCENLSNISSELKTARTSTPIDSEPEALAIKKSRGTNTVQLPKESDVTDISEARRNGSIETRDASTSVIFDRECQTIPETRDAIVQYEMSERMVCSSTMTTEVSNREVSVQSQTPEDNVIEISDILSGTGMKSIAIQSEFLDLSLSSTTASTVTSDNEFLDDLLSEGEIHLPWNLRLLSLIERGIIPRNVPLSLDLSGATSKTMDEPSLSEGEIHPKYLSAMIQNISESQRSQSMTSNSPAVLYSSDSSVIEPVPQKPCDRCQFSDSQTGSLRSDLSEGQIPNPSILRPDSALSSSALTSGGDNNSVSDVECVPLKTARPQDFSEPFPVVASASSVSVSCKLPSLPSASLPETNHNILDSSKFRSFLHTTSELNPSTSCQAVKDLKHPIKFTSPSLEKYLGDIRVSQTSGISKSPDLKTVTEEDFNESKDDTDTGSSKDNQLSSDISSSKPEDNDESSYFTDSSQNAN